MIPVADDNAPNRRAPVVTYLLLALNIAAFVLLQQCGADTRVSRSLGAVPQELIEGRDIVTADQVFRSSSSGQAYRIPGLLETPVWVYATIIISMFLHGSLGHLIGNMLYLSIFGDNIENRMGRTRYLIFYLVVGTIAAAAQVLAAALSGRGLLTPMIGASGAISGVMGAYLVLYPRNRVYILAFGILPLPVRAWIVLALWFLMQVGNVVSAGPSGSGVAYAAHIGGFLAGWLWARIYMSRERTGRPRGRNNGGVQWRVMP